MLPHARGAPLVSIVTAVRDAGRTVERAIRSVLAQTYAPIEHIVIDGGSTDDTLERIRRYEDRLAHWVSEPDRGIADAFNKGLEAARGELIGFLNADDWMEPEQIEHAVAALCASDAAFVFGDVVYHDRRGMVRHRIVGDPHYDHVIASRMPELNHPTVLARRLVFERIGGFDERYRTAMDYDWLLRAHRAGFRGRYVPQVVAHMTLAGVSDAHYRRALAEVRQIAIRHGQPRLRAWPLYGWRLAKGTTRRALAAHLPRPAYEWLRGRINRRYAPGR